MQYEQFVVILASTVGPPEQFLFGSSGTDDLEGKKVRLFL
jgi:hypothetical protein